MLVSMQWASKDNKLLSMHRLSPTPFSSDEGAESGDDSEEDLVTNYLAEPTAAANPSRDLPSGLHQHHHHHHPQQLPLHQCHQPPQQAHGHGVGVSVQPAHGHCTPRRLVRMAEIPTMDSVTAESLGMGTGVGGQSTEAFIPPIPTISITPHSPITQKPFTVLEESLRQLQILQEKIQRMREGPQSSKGGRCMPRLSSSCPSLNVEGEEIDDEEPTSCSEEFLLEDARKVNDAHRRRSWSGLSDEEKKRARQRSVSLSSLDSDTEEPFYEAEDSANTQGSDSLDGSSRRAADKQRSLSGSSSPVAYVGRAGGSSTHSLNEAHFGAKVVKSSTSEKPRLLAPRLTLQKSISTPSILAGVQNQHQQQLQQVPQLSYHPDEHSTSKPRKRASVFFFRKKEKSKKTSHQFMSVCYGNSTTCDVCNKPMTNKPALKCESCYVCVHENSCKDQISDCSKLKNSKAIQKVGGSSGNLHSSTKSASLGSAPGASNSANSGFRSQQASVTRPRSSVTITSSPTRPYGLTTSKVTNEEKEEQHQDLIDVNILDVNSASTESLEESGEGCESALHNIDSDPDLKLLESEPENWVDTVEKEFVNQLTEKQKKRQAAIYELIITEKHHCRMLKILKELFAEVMLRELGLKETLVRSIFPRLDELINIHFSFLWRLREQQRASKFIDNIGDLLYNQFMADNAHCFKEAYGEFCSKHKDALASYKVLLKSDRRFQDFISKRANHPLMNKKGIPEVILFVTHRMTKYPLIIEAIIKYTHDNPEELESLRAALECVKEILVYINDKVAEEESNQRLFDIYYKIDAKSYTTYKDHKFKKSDLLTNGRKLKFEGQALLTLPQSRSKPIQVVVIVLSDLIFFLQENNQKYHFFSPDNNKPGVVPLLDLLVRDKASQDTSSIYLISGNHTCLFELECVHPKDRKCWLDSIREAALKEDFRRNSKLKEANAEKLHEMIMFMQQQDRELCRICEDKMRTVKEFYSELGCEEVIEPISYRDLLEENNLDALAAKELQISSLNEALRLVSGACGWGTNLARSVSSVGERQSEAYVSPSLPKRAETFGGFDNPNKDNSLHPSKQSSAKKKKDSKVSLISETGTDAPEAPSSRRPSGSIPAIRSSQDNLSLASALSAESSSGSLQQQQQLFANNLMQCLQTALVLSQHHLTQYEMLKEKIATGATLDHRFSHSQKLEELRNIQEQISHGRAQWTKEKEHQEKWISDKREELRRREEMLRLQQEDINQQREDLFRKLEALKNQGVVLNPSLTTMPSALPPPLPTAHDGSTPSTEILHSQVSPHTSPTSTVPARSRQEIKHRNSNVSLPGLKRDSTPSLPTHLISAVNQHVKAAMPPKQQLPMKLAKLGTGGSSSSSSTSSMSSSMSSSLSGSFGSSMSPSQDKGDLVQSQVPQARVHSVSPSGVGGTVQQILPLKLSEGANEPKGPPRFTGGYQRLASPPSNVIDPPPPGPVHQRTGSSPASLQNGSPSAPTPVTTSLSASTGATVVMGSARREELGAYSAERTSRTHTYPKLPTKPEVSHMSKLPDPPDPASRTRPGQRIKDPDTDQDIIFF